MNEKSARLTNLINGVSEKLVMVLFFLISPVAIAAPKGIVPLLAIAGVSGMISWLHNGRPTVRLPRLPMLLLVLTMLWALISSLWAIDTTGAAILTARLTVLCVCGLALMHTLTKSDDKVRRRLEYFFLTGYGLGAVVLLTGYFYARMTNTSLWSSFANDPLTTLNNGATMMALLYFPFAVILWKRNFLRIAIAAGVLLLGGLYFLSSEAAVLSLIAGTAVCILVIVMGRTGIFIVAGVICATFIAAPTLSEVFLAPSPAGNYEVAPPTSTEHRKLIWQFVNGRISEKPVWGWGMDSSREIPKEAFRISSNLEVLPLHPHNSALQVRLELGWPGTILVAALIASLFWVLCLPGLSVIPSAVGAAVISSYMTTGYISYGVWQNWWVAAAWAIAGLTWLVSNSKGTE